MAKKANPKLIGGFVIGAIALAIIGVITFGGTQFLAPKDRAVLFFSGSSLSGLDVGSPVTFRGIKVGDHDACPFWLRLKMIGREPGSPHPLKNAK